MAETQAPSISNRMNDIIQTLLPVAAAAATDYAEPNPEVVNLSVAANKLIRSELLDICNDVRSSTFTHLLNSAELLALLSKNNSLLAKSYDLLSSTLTRIGIEFLPANAGFVVFAKFVKNAKCWEDEAALVQGLKEYKVIVSAGKGFNGSEEEKGWVRIRETLLELKCFHVR